MIIILSTLAGTDIMAGYCGHWHEDWDVPADPRVADSPCGGGTCKAVKPMSADDIDWLANW